MHYLDDGTLKIFKKEKMCSLSVRYDVLNILITRAII